jgi:protein involved in polysaccharide export with SLBB domain
MSIRSFLIVSILFFGAFHSFSQDIPASLQNIDPIKLQSILQSYQSQLQGLGVNADEASSLLQKHNSAKSDPVNVNVNNENQTNVTEPIKSKPAVNLPSSNENLDPKIAKRFGLSIFYNQDYKTFKQNTDLIAPENYVIGTGDKINIAIWGFSSYSNSFIVDETGAIFPSNIGKIFIRGLTLRDARNLIKSKFSSSFNFSNNEIEVNIIGSRNVTVNIVGDISNPGSYTLPAYNTLFNMLIAAGGPTLSGSIRSIYVKRNGSTAYTFDTYDFLLNPEAKIDFYLQDNDYIFVPIVSRLVEIQGEILRPYEFELKPGENFNKLLLYAGGFTASANTQHLIVKRITPEGIAFLDLPYDSLQKSNKDFMLQSGDVIIVKSKPTQHKNRVVLKGAISSPGEQSILNNDKISDLLKRNPLLDETYLDQAFITRTQDDYTLINIPFSPAAILADYNSADNLLLKNNDIIYFFSKKDFTDNLIVSIAGAVRMPGQYSFASNMTLGQLLFLSGGFKDDADLQRIEISRVYESNAHGFKPVPVLIKTIQLSNAKLTNGDANFILQPNDLVVVRSVSTFSDLLNVTVKGEVMFPGNYSLLDKNERVSSIIKRAGGLTTFAYPENGLLYRNSEGKGAIALRLDKILAKPGSRFDVIMKKGDLLEITTRSNIVSISGEIFYPLNDSSKYVNVTYEPGRRAKYYIKKYGLGFNKFSKRSRTYVINPGNNLRTCKKYILFNRYPKVKPGSIVVVPPVPNKELKYNAERTPVDWNKTIESITLKVTALATLLVILSRIQF